MLGSSKLSAKSGTSALQHIALTDLEKENNIGSDILIEKIKSGIEKAIKKDYPYC